MAFQAGGPHAQDRGLEAVAVAYDEMIRTPRTATWEKPQGRSAPIVLEKHWRVISRGIGLVIGCQTFPTWNSYPGLFADLATGNTVIVKPHPNAILLSLSRFRFFATCWSKTAFRRMSSCSRRTSRARNSPASSPPIRMWRSSITRGRAHLATGFARMPARRCSIARKPASTRSSSPQRTISRGSAPTSPFRWRSTVANVHRPAGHFRARRRHRHEPRPQELR